MCKLLMRQQQIEVLYCENHNNLPEEEEFGDHTDKSRSRFPGLFH